jgi:hypothetical protein
VYPCLGVIPMSVVSDANVSQSEWDDLDGEMVTVVGVGGLYIRCARKHRMVHHAKEQVYIIRISIFRSINTLHPQHQLSTQTRPPFQTKHPVLQPTPLHQRCRPKSPHLTHQHPHPPHLPPTHHPLSTRRPTTQRSLSSKSSHNGNVRSIPPHQLIELGINITFS